MAQDLKDTLQLPKTDFAMRAGLAQREPGRVAHWESIGLYARLQQNRAQAEKTFVLHDGPPFTNGDVHIGTALNKTLKDITLRYKTLRGYRTPQVPGWDCHGLPIDQKVTREHREKVFVSHEHSKTEGSRDAPGPGQYPMPALTGKPVKAGLQKSGAAWGFGSSKRFSDLEKERAPGPGYYVI